MGLWNTDLFNEYLEYKKVTWSEATLKSEAARLSAVKPLVDQAQRPEDLLAAVLQRYRPYTAKIVLTRLGDFETWAIMELKMEGPGFMPELLRRSYRRLQGSYRKERVLTSFDSAKKRIAAISDPEVRDHATALLVTGLRVHESFIVDEKEETVVGKGGMKRRVFNLNTANARLVPGMTYERLYKGLKAVELKPHSLRKIAATHYAEILSPRDLMAVMGWSNMNTAMVYWQATQDDGLAAKLKERVG